MEQRQKGLRRKDANRSEQEIKSLLAQYAGQESTVKEFCARFEIAKWAFYARKKKYGSTVTKPEQAAGFVALRVQGPANSESRSDASLFAEVYRRLCKAHLIIIDDIMMIEIARREANAFFHFVNALHEKVSFVSTTNKSPKQWAENLGDEVITTAKFAQIYHFQPNVSLDLAETRSAKGVSAKWYFYVQEIDVRSVL